MRDTYNFISIDIPSYSIIEATEVAVTQVNYLIWLGWRAWCMNTESNYLIKHSVHSTALRVSPAGAAVPHWNSLPVQSSYLPRFKMFISPTQHCAESPGTNALKPDLYHSFQHCMQIQSFLITLYIQIHYCDEKKQNITLLTWRW